MMKIKYKKEIAFVATLLILGQLIFYFISPRFTQISYDNRIYATIGVEFEEGDLNGLNEAANNFGKTIIGWLKFPSFMGQLSEVVTLPEGSSISAYEQEKQNIIFNIHTFSPIETKALLETKDYIQDEIDEYNTVSDTRFILTNFDYEHVTLQKSYKYGALITLIASIIVALGLLFIRKEIKD